MNESGKNRFKIWPVLIVAALVALLAATAILLNVFGGGGTAYEVPSLSFPVLLPAVWRFLAPVTTALIPLVTS